MTAFRVVSTTTRWRGSFLTVDELAVEAPGSDEHLSRCVVRHPGAVVVVPVDVETGTAVLVRQFRAVVGGELLEAVAGKRDVAGEPPDETARRELAEELGYRAGRLVPLAEFYNSPGFCDEYSYLYCALDLEELEERQPVTDEEAAMTVERVPLDRVDELVADGTITDAKTIIGLLLARRHVAGSER